MRRARIMGRAVLIATGAAWVSCGCTESPPAPVARPPANQIATQPPVVERFDESRFYRTEDKFLAVDFPNVCRVEQATFIDDHDEVIGFVVAGKARAYPLHSLCYHHVINDTIGETPIAVTY